MPYPEFDPTPHDRIAVTAINSAMNLALAGMQYAPEIAECARVIWQEGNHTEQPELIDPHIHAPGTELRYRQASRALLGARQIVDIAAGLTPRGLSMASYNPGLTYVEFDLPIMSRLKRDVFTRLADSNVLPAAPSNLHFLTGNVVDSNDVTKIAQYVDTAEPLAVTTEGLLHYLPHSEKAAAAANIATLLRGNPQSYWLTDMPTQQGITAHDHNLARATSEQSNRDVAANRFETQSEAAQFFADLGLAVTAKYSYADPLLLLSLTSLECVGANMATIAEINAPWSLWEFQTA